MMTDINRQCGAPFLRFEEGEGPMVGLTILYMVTTTTTLAMPEWPIQ